MEGSGRKSRVYLIEGKRLVQGDPNLVTENEIMLKPVTVEGKQAYMLVDNKGDVLSSNGQEVVVPATKYLYCARSNGYYRTTNMESIESASDYVEWVIDSDKESKNSSQGCISVGGKTPTPELPVLTLSIESRDNPGIAPSSKEILDYCLDTNYVPEFYGPFLRVCPSSHSGDYTNSTQWKISPFKAGDNIAYIVDRNNEVIASYKDNFAALRQ